MKYTYPAMLLVFATLLASCSNRKMEVDLVLTNGNFQTMDRTYGHAEAIAIDDGKIVGVGSEGGVASRYAGKVTIDLKGAYVLPGLIDGHAHMLELGMSLQTLDLTDTRSPQEVARLVEAATGRTRLGGWIRGSGWDAATWKSCVANLGGLLDKAAPDNFVFLVSADGREAWVNSKVLGLAGVTGKTAAPSGGKIFTDRKGNPTGVLEGSAIGLVAEKIPPPSEEELEEALTLAADTCARYGITEVQDAGIDSRTLEAYKLLADQNKLKIRIYAMYDGNDSTLPVILKTGRIIDYKGFLTMRSVRIDMDGSLASRQAALVRAYSDAPGEYGCTQFGVKDIENLTVASVSSGFQVCTDAHGDRSIDVVLNGYEKALELGGLGNPRLRIEGVDVLLPEDLGRFRLLGIIPSMQPARCTSDMYWVESRLGPDRVRNYSMWNSLVGDGNEIVGGSDFPMQSPDPRIGIYAAVTRRDLNGLPGTFADARKYFRLTADAAVDSSDFDGGFFYQQAMSLRDALKSFTTWAAYGAFQEHEKGSITVGKLADLTLLRQDFNKIRKGEIPDDPILGTIVGGRLVYVSPLAQEWTAR